MHETLVTSTTQSNPAVASPAPEQTTAPAIDWTPHVPKGAEKVFESYKGKPLSDVLNSVVEAQKLIGGSIRLPKADAKPEEREKALDDIFNKLGRPEDPSKYDLGELPEVPGVKWDDARLSAAKAELHKARLTNDQVKLVFSLFGKEIGAMFPDHSAVAAQSREQLIQELGSEAAFTRQIAYAQQAIRQFGGDEMTQYLDQTGLGNHPAMVKFAAKIGRELAEHGAMEPATGKLALSTDEAQKQVAEIMNNPKDLYFAQPGTPGKAERMKEVELLFKIVAGEI